MSRKYVAGFSLIPLALPSIAAAHVVFSQDQARSGGYYAGFLRVSHGCGDSPTVALQVTVPEGVVSARPQPKAGWTLKIAKVPLAKPVAGEGGSVLSQRVGTITWTGHLPIDEFDEFGLSLKLADVAGALLPDSPAVRVRREQLDYHP
jgi:hypothetical protein